VQNLVAGKRIPEATQVLKDLKDVQNVTVQISPSFIPWVTSWAHNINVVLEAGAPPKSSPKR
jgi:hypothetical protein